MDRPSPRTLARLAGALFLITFVTSIPAVLLYHSILNDTDFITGGAGANGPVFLGAFLELLLIVANIGTALALFPIVKRQSEGFALVADEDGFEVGDFAREGASFGVHPA